MSLSFRLLLLLFGNRLFPVGKLFSARVGVLLYFCTRISEIIAEKKTHETSNSMYYWRVYVGGMHFRER